MKNRVFLSLLFLFYSLSVQALAFDEIGEKHYIQGIIKKGYSIIKTIQRNGLYPHSLYFFEENHPIFSDFTWGESLTVQKNLKFWTECLSFGSIQLEMFDLSEKALQRKAYLESIICVVWALWDYSRYLNEDFQSGSFSILDKDERLFNFFSFYMTFLNYESIEDLSYGPYVATNVFGDSRSAFIYNRTPEDRWVAGSSHYKSRKSIQIGLDMRFSELGYNQPVLPHGMTTLIFGKIFGSIEEGLLSKTFVKWEPYGSGDLSSTFNHSLDYLGSLFWRKNKRSEKDIIPLISKEYKNFFSLYDGLDSKLKSLKKGELGQAVYYANEILTKNLDVSAQLKEASKKFLKVLEDQYGKREIHNGHAQNLAFYRTGHEVVLSLEEVQEPIQLR